MVFSLGPNVNNLKEEILYNWPSSDNTLVRRHIIQNEYYEVDSKVKFKFTSDQRSAPDSKDEQSSRDHIRFQVQLVPSQALGTSKVVVNLK